MMLRRLGRVTLLLFGLAVLYVGVTFAQVWWASRQDDRPVADAIVVMGAAQYDGRPSNVLAARLDHAHELWLDGVAPVIVVTGGSRPGDRFTEAAAGASYLHDLGVPDAAIRREVSGRSSWESLAAVSRFLTEVGSTEVVLVSDPFHAMRIASIAEEVGLDAAVSPTADSPIDGADELRNMVRETAGVAVGRLVGFRRLDLWSGNLG
jgi:vancomycin permeability regulator SanA